MKKRVKINLGVSPVPGTSDFSDPIDWERALSHYIISRNKEKKFPRLYPTRNYLTRDVYQIKYLNKNYGNSSYYGYTLSRTFIITQIYEEKG